MALLIKDSYIKLDIDGTYTIYKTKAARNRIKKTTNFEDVINKYYEILDKLTLPEYIYYNQNAYKEIAIWKAEFNYYYYNLTNSIYGAKYPLMEKYIPDIAKTIPEIISTGKLGYLAARVNTLEELYKLVKEKEIFGPKEETKDI